MLTSKLITSRAGLEALRPSWEELLGRSASDEVTLHPTWVLAWWDVYGEGRELRVLGLYDGQRLVGLAPLVARQHLYRPRIPFRRLELVGSGENEADETCSDYLGLVAERGREADVVAAFAAAMHAGIAGTWDELVFRAMNGASPIPELLRTSLGTDRIETALDAYDKCSFAELPKTWEAYQAGLKRKKRWQLRQVMKGFEEWAGHAPVIHRVREASELETAQRTLYDLHHQRWGNPGVFGSMPFRRFHEKVMAELLPKGALSLGWLEARGEPVAAFYNFRWAGREWHYQSGRKVGLPDNVRVGIVMNAMLIHDAIEAGLSEYDFLGGPAVYKTALAPSSRSLVQLRVVKPSLVELARRAAERALVVARRIKIPSSIPKPPPQSVR